MRDQRERGACVTFPEDAPTIVEEGDRAPPTPVLEDSQMVIVRLGLVTISSLAYPVAACPTWPVGS